MLFLLTGDVQIGKTRWLERLAAELAAEGVTVAGVVAPGVWRADGAGSFEKLGIDNVLLPQAMAEGSFDPTSQSAAAQLAWEISDDAIAEVNRHFDAIMRTDVSRETSGGAADAGEVDGAFRGLAVVDELGRLELMRDCGLTSAVALLDAGPTARFPHALAVVRDWLLPNAEARFAARWGGAQVLAPGDDARVLVRAACGLDR